MKHLRLVLPGLAACVCLAIGSGFAAVQKTTWDGPGQGLPAEPQGSFHSEMPNLWFVELSSPPLTEANAPNETKYLNKLKQEKQDFRLAARHRGIRFTERYAYDRLWNGLSLEVDPAQLMDLSNTQGVAAIYPVLPVAEPPAAVPVGLESGAAADLFTAITMTGADQVQREGITGAGVKVGVIDTGIDYTHPDLGGGFELGPSQPITINPANGESAPVIFHLDYSVRRIRVELNDAVTGQSYGRLFEANYFPRNSGPDFFYILSWQGRDADGVELPAGQYRLRLSIEKALGEDDNPAHWEIWSSPVVTVVR